MGRSTSNWRQRLTTQSAAYVGKDGAAACTPLNPRKIFAALGPAQVRKANEEFSLLYLTALLSSSTASYGATPGEAPRAVACNEGDTGALAESDNWVLAKSDTQDDGNDHYKVLALSAWASAGNSTYCVRWELENQSPKNPPTATGTAPVLKNLGWSDVDLYKDRLEPGGSDKRAVKWIKRDYNSTPIDQNTDVTGATDATFKLKAFLPRTQTASAKPSYYPPVEKFALGGHLAEQDKFGDIITGYSEGSNSVLITSSAKFDGKQVLFAISVRTPHGTPFKTAKFPFAFALLKAIPQNPLLTRQSTHRLNFRCFIETRSK